MYVESQFVPSNTIRRKRVRQSLGSETVGGILESITRWIYGDQGVHLDNLVGIGSCQWLVALLNI